MPQWRVLKCLFCQRLTDLQELAQRSEKAPLGCGYCGKTSFDVKLIGSDTVGAPKRGNED